MFNKNKDESVDVSAEEQPKPEVTPEVKSSPKVAGKSYRLLRCPNQTSEVQVYFDQDHHAINIPKDGYHFSMDPEMDATIEFLKETYGMEEVK